MSRTHQTKQKKVFTTGEVARLLSVNINTVIKWFDDGRIEGFRLPVSNDRRIPIGSLKQFMVNNSIPLDLLEENTPMRRKFERIRCNQKIKFSVMNGRAFGPYEGRLGDLSMGGARIKTVGSDALEIPTQSFKMDFKIEEGELSDIGFNGKIVHIRPGEDTWAIGMEFEDLNEIQLNTLSTFIDKTSHRNI